MSEMMTLQADETTMVAIDRELADAMRSNAAMLLAIRWLVSFVLPTTPAWLARQSFPANRPFPSQGSCR
jgi:hypothetical protein